MKWRKKNTICDYKNIFMNLDPTVSVQSVKTYTIFYVPFTVVYGEMSDCYPHMYDF